MLEQNLAALEKTNPKLVKKLEETELTGKAELFLGPFEDINIAYDGIALHQIQDPMGESKIAFEEGVPEDARDHKSIIFLFGMGIGYLFRRAFVETKARIIVFEPYPEVLKLTLDAVDFTQELASARVHVITDISEITMAMGTHFMRGDNFSNLALPQYQAKEQQLFLDVLNEIKSVLYLTIISQNTAVLKMEEFTQSCIENLADVIQYPDAAMMHDTCQGKVGVVVSAGPSLDQPGAIEAMKQYRDHMIISCVGQAARALDKAGIIPDIVNVVETQDVSHQLDHISTLEEINLLLLPQANKKIFKYPTKRKFMAFSNSDPVTNWLAQALDSSLFGYNHVGTVSITALIHLMKMGCNPIFLIGQDLGFPDGKMYADNSVYSGRKLIKDENGKLVHEWGENKKEFEGVYYWNEESDKAKAEQYCNSLIEAKGWNGEPMKANMAYEAFRKAFENIRACHPDTNIVNCSVGGVSMAGYEQIPFVEALEKYQVKAQPNNQEFHAFLETHYEETQPYSERYDAVFKHYQKEKENLDLLEAYITEGLTCLEKAFKEFKNRKAITPALSSVLQRLVSLDEEVSDITKSSFLINCYVKQEMFLFARDYGRKLELDEEAVQGDLEELEENLENTQLLYDAIDKGLVRLKKTFEKVFDTFPSSLNEAVAPQPV